MSEKKRKGTSLPEGRPKKRQQTSQPMSVEYIQSAGTLTPIIATTPGTTFPRDVKFQTYTKKTSNGDANLLLHTSDHPTIDYTAVEGADSTSDFLKHYIAVYDPTNNKLQLTEAKSLTVRGAVRQRRNLEASDNDGEEGNATNIPPSNQGTRAALTEAFGSKKSKKAVQSMAENRQLGQGGQGATIAEAMIADISSDDEEEVTDLSKAAAAAAHTNKPLPRPNLTTSEIDQVYSLSSLILPHPASTTLALMPINLWTARLKANKEVSHLRSRFVANRLSYLAKRAMSATADDENSSTSNTYTQHLQLLRYIELLVEIAQYAGKFNARIRLPFSDRWPEGTISNAASIPSHVVKEITRHFFPDNLPSQHAVTLLRTTILALTLHIPPPSGFAGPNALVAEPTDIHLDLALDVNEARKLYHELGCKVAPAKEKELATWGYQKLMAGEKAKKKKASANADGDGPAMAVKAPKIVFAVLKFPLEFPKVSTGRRPQGGRR